MIDFSFLLSQIGVYFPLIIVAVILTFVFTHIIPLYGGYDFIGDRKRNKEREKERNRNMHIDG